jgi:hypothetical protein
MKKLVTSNIVEGVRQLGAVKAFFEHMESAYLTAIGDIVVGLSASSSVPVSLYGVVNSGSGSNFNISAGAIVHNGEVFTIPAFSGNAPGAQVPTLRLVETKQQLVYTDGSNQDTLNTRTYVWQFGAAGSGLANFSDVVTLKQRINSNLLDVPGQINTAVNALVGAAPGALDTLNELAAALGNNPNFATTITTALAGKAPIGRQISAGNGLSGGGDMNADRTFDVNVDGVSIQISGDSLRLPNGHKAVQSPDASQLYTKKITVNGWNADASEDLVVAHGLTASKILKVSATIYSNGGSSFNSDETFIGSQKVTSVNWNSTNIVLNRLNGSFVDSSDFNNASVKFLILYEE